jgi:hypothetical protein
MKTKLNTFASIMFAFLLAAVAGPLAQTGPNSAAASGGGHTATDKSIAYHGGPVLTDNPGVYFILTAAGA